MIYEERIYGKENYAAYIRVEDVSRPLVFTFDNLFTAGPDLSRDGWGKEWCLKHKLNYISFLESDGPRAYSCDGFIELIADVRSRISRFNIQRRIAYGASMGGYAALSHAKNCNVDTVLAINPILPANKDTTNWIEERFSSNRPSNWLSPWQEHTYQELEEIRVMTLYDPFQKIDKLHAKLIPGEKYIVPFLGHALEAHASSIGLIGAIFRTALKDKTSGEDASNLIRVARKRREKMRYYSLIGSRYNKHQTPMRRQIVIAYAALLACKTSLELSELSKVIDEYFNWADCSDILSAALILKKHKTEIGSKASDLLCSIAIDRAEN